MGNEGRVKGGKWCKGYRGEWLRVKKAGGLKVGNGG